MNYEYFMALALTQAKNALENNEFPVGCVLVYENQVIVTGARNGTANGGKNEVDHAEILALRRLYTQYPDINTKKITLFCTMEPCLMCFGAILISGIDKIVYAYEDVMGGGTGCDRSNLPPLYKNRQISIKPNVLRAESLALFKSFFENPANNYWKNSLLASYTRQLPILNQRFRRGL